MRFATKEQITALFSKKEVTLLVTDSGLGGLSIFAKIAARLEREPIFPKANLVYYNAWPEQTRGYNAISKIQERIRVFEGALEGMRPFHPDLILIACNTLSVLYGRTAFSREETFPVVDIVEFGVDGVYESLSKEPRAKAVLLGTVTTIASGVHRSQLVKRGITPEQIVVQPCDQLATQIEKGPGSEAVAHLVDLYTGQAAKRLGQTPSGVTAALFCTHFGYSRELIRQKLQSRVEGRVTVVDPNRRMADFLFDASNGIRHNFTVVDMQVVSRIVLDPEKREAISKILEKESARTALALRNYRWAPELFAF